VRAGFSLFVFFALVLEAVLFSLFILLVFELPLLRHFLREGKQRRLEGSERWEYRADAA
jgi:hypothetical protein